MKWIAFILVPVIFLNAVGLNAENLMRMGDLMEHAQLHQKNYGDDFLSFLSKHYGKESLEHQNHPDHDANDHEQLPFKHLGQTVLFVLMKPIWPQLPPQIDSWRTNRVPLQKKSFLTSLYIDSLLEPPQFG